MHRFAFFLAIASGLTASLSSALAGAEEPARPEPARVITSNRDAKQPQVAIDSKGRVYVAFGQGSFVKLAVSTDRGRTFETSDVGSAGALSLGMRRGPRIAVTNDSLVVTAICGSRGNGQDGDVLAWRSIDIGRTWKGPARVNGVEGSAREGLHAMASSTSGAVFCTWLDLRKNRTEIYGARSTDGGRTWEPDVLIYKSPENSVCECCHPSAAFSPDGTLYVMWRNSLKGARDPYLASSSDGGKTFGPAQKLGQGTWILNACPMDGGALAAGRGGKVETVWMRAGQMFMATPGEKEKSLGRGVQGWCAFGVSGPLTVWLEKRPGKLLALPPTSSSTITLSEKANDPVVAASTGGELIVTAWESKTEEGGILARVFSPADGAVPR